jgi:hypothetical protein
VPRRAVRAAGHLRKRSLGWLALVWIEALTVHGPGDVQGEPVVHGDEISEFIADCYALERSGRLLYDSAFLSRPKGADKSGLGGRLSLFEALGPCRFEGWAKGGEVYRDPFDLGFEYTYEKGDPMGRPVRAPFIRCMATEEGQTGNVYDTVHLNLTEGPLARVKGLDPGLTRVFLPGGGEIRPSTASSSSKDGGRETFVVFDESHLYNTPELRRMYATVTRNLRKRKGTAGTWYLETTTMYAPGEDSVAEGTYSQAEKVLEGRTKRQRLLYDHRWGECEDLSDEKALRAALADAYKDVDWADIDSLVDEFHDIRNAVSDSRRYFLNAPTAASDAWLAPHEWAARIDVTKTVADREVVTLGFDGSRRRARGVTDATALIGCRVKDGHVFEIKVWEQPQGPEGAQWSVPTAEVDAAVRQAFRNYRVVGFFADPAKWETWVAGWEADFGSGLKVKASQSHPIEWWMTGGRASKAVQALDEFHTAVIDGLMTHDGSSILTRHIVNARRRTSKVGVQIAKETPESPKKIDGAVAATLAWQARLEAIAKGLDKQNSSSVPRRIR